MIVRGMNGTFILQMFLVLVECVGEVSRSFHGRGRD